MEELQKQIDELKERIYALEKKDDYDEELYNELKLERITISNENKIPAFRVFTNEVLREICRKKPTTKEELMKIKGIKEAKCHQFGDIILQVVSRHV